METLNIDRNSIVQFKSITHQIERLLNNKENRKILVAIDGKCASGKSTLGFLLANLYDANLFHMDDYFLQGCQRTEKRLQEVGGNVDYERFKEEVLKPLLNDQNIWYRPFNCHTCKIEDGHKIMARRLNIIEGAYSQHPYFEKPYHLCLFLDNDPYNQIEVIRKRNGEQELARFMEEWIPKENEYFKKYEIKEKSIKIEWMKGVMDKVCCVESYL